ncbi:holin [Arthrobacter rhombi]|uniref:holin n=1 Tax=Arthrobacter rhombi TaxID=71253 RepID=UPI003FD22F33
MLTKQFWQGAAERAVKTFFQVFVAVALAGVGADAIGNTAGIGDISWLNALSVAALAVILSVATSLGNADFTAGKLPEGDVQIGQIDEMTTVTKYRPTPGMKSDSGPQHLQE